MLTTSIEIEPKRRRTATVRAAILTLIILFAQPASAAGPFEVPPPALAAPMRAAPTATEQPLRTHALDRSPSLGAQDLPSPRAVGLAIRAGTSDPLAASLEALRTHPELAGVDASDLRHLVTHRTPTGSFVHFTQIFQEAPILGSRVTFYWTNEGRLALFGADLFDPDHAPLGVWGAEPLASQRATWDLPSAAETIHWERAWLPLDHQGATRLTPVLRVCFRTEEPPGDWESWVDATRGTLLYRHNRIVEARGRVEGQVEAVTAGGRRSLEPFAELGVSFTQGERALVDTTDGAGRFVIPGAESGRFLRRAELRGRAVWIRDVSQALRTPFDTLTVGWDDTSTVQWDEDNSTFAQRDAYFHATRARALARALDPGTGLSALDHGLELRVDDPSGHCNAYWRGDYFVFTAAGSGCPATARIADVVYHEYAHAVTQLCYAPFPIPADLNEGLSDYFAASITDQPEIGIGFRGPGTYLREVESDRIWPADQNGDPHLQGLIVASALWDLRASVGAGVADSLAHYARYGAAVDMHDYLLDLLVVDDRDGDLTNGSPHFAAITNAFLAHGLGDFSVRISPSPLTDQEAPGPTIEAETRIDALLGLDPDSLGLFVANSESGPFDRIALIRDVASRTYRATLTTPPLGSTVYYYWAASDTAGHRARVPADLDSVARFYVGPDVIPPLLTHDPPLVLAADLDTLRLRANASDNGGPPRRVMLSITPDGGDSIDAELRPLAGGSAWVSALPLSSLAPGTQLGYHLTATDRAINPNETRAPSEGDYSIELRAGRSSDFESDAGPIVATGDWEWGAPDTALTAYSGTRVWATNLRGPYRDAQRSELVFGPVDLSTFDRARLQFRHWYRFESGYDGGMVQASSDAGVNWVPLYPDGGYPSRRVSALDAAGWSGASGDWTQAECPLDAFVGRTVLVRLVAASDAYVNDLGWYLDDVAVIAAQARSRPSSFTARGGEDGRVALAWQAPIGVDRASARFFGYNVYRRESGGAWPATPLNPEPIRALELIDRSVSNGTRYGYRLVASYDEGESRPVEREATPFAASIALDVDRLDFSLRGRIAADTTLFVRNVSGGNLRVNAYLAESDWSIDDARAAWVVAGADSIGRVRLLSDDRDEGAAADLESLELAPRSDPEQGPLLDFVVRGWTRWPSPTREWGGVLFLDVDGDLSTGSLDFGWNERLNLGWDYAVLFGKLARDQGSNANAVLLKPGTEELTPLGDTSFPDGADSVRFALPTHLVGDPERIEVALCFSVGRTEAPFDRAPELPKVDWLTRQPRSGRALVDHPQPFSVRFDGRASGNGDYQAKLILETNDRAHPVLEMPVTARVSDWIPDTLERQSFASTSNGIAIEFQLPVPVRPRVARIERALASAPVWQRVGPDSLFPDSTRTFRALDTEVEVGQRYLYRFQVVASNAPYRVYGPFEATYDPSDPVRLALGAVRPNPVRRELSARLDLPTTAEVQLRIFDITGRMVAHRNLGVLPAGLHEIGWALRGDTNRNLAPGIYWLRVGVSSRSLVRRFVLLP